MSLFDENAGNIMKNIIDKTEYHDVTLVAGIDLQKYVYFSVDMNFNIILLTLLLISY